MVPGIVFAKGKQEANTLPSENHKVWGILEHHFVNQESMWKKDSFVSQQKARRKLYFTVIGDMGAQRAQLKPIPKQPGCARLCRAVSLTWNKQSAHNSRLMVNV